MSSPPSNIHYPITKQHRKGSSSFRKNSTIIPHVHHKIKPQLLWSFDSPRKDSKRQARLHGIKFFYSLEIKMCNRDYRFLKCLKSDKPCCRYLTMKIDKPSHYTFDDFPVRKHHLKLFKIDIGAKAHLHLRKLFWRKISPQVTALDYISNEINNFKQLITKSSALHYRNLNNFSFPIVRNMSHIYDALFTFLKNLRALKMLSFNTVSQINPTDASYILTALNQLFHLRGLNLALKGSHSICVDTLSQTLQAFHRLRFLSLQFGKISTRNVQELLLQKVSVLTQQLQTVTHLELEVYLETRYKDTFSLFLASLENLHSLVSLDLKIDRGVSSFAEKLNLPDIQQSVLKKVKYFSLEGNKHGIGVDLAEYFLSKTENLQACHLKNVELEKCKESSIDLAEIVLKNECLKELKLVFEDTFNSKELEKLFENTKKFENLQLFSIQLHSPEAIEFNLESLINGIVGLQKVDTIMIEILYPIKLSLVMLNKLVDNLTKLKRLSGIKLDLRLMNELKGSCIKKLFMLGSLDVITLIIEGMKLTKEDQKFIKEHTKKMRKLTSCIVECEDFKVDRLF